MIAAPRGSTVEARGRVTGRKSAYFAGLTRDTGNRLSYGQQPDASRFRALGDLSNIRVPAIRSVEISGYALFPGTDGTGLSHKFENGVSVIAGINGLGKTTLLNALLRLLIGPWDVRREDPEDVGSTRHELISWRMPSYFSGRVPDDALSASIAARVSFGRETIYVVRSLKDLSVQQLHYGEQRMTATDAEYQKLVVRLSGVDSFYDFHFLVRNLIFYLEDRRPLVLTDDGQFEIARILFIPGTESTAFSELYDEIKRVDSRYRNLLTETNRLVKRLKDQRRAEGAKPSNLSAIAALKDAYAGSETALERVEGELDAAIEQERATSEEMRRAQMDLEAAFRDYEGLQQDYFARAFPNGSETLHYIFAHIVSDGGCLVCGSDAREKAQELKSHIAEGKCPVCGSLPTRQELFVASSEVAAERVNRTARDLDARQRALLGLSEHRQAVVARVEALLEERRRLQETLEDQRAKLAALGARLPAPSAAISELETSVKVNQENLSTLLKDRTERIARYRRMMQEASDRIVKAHAEVKKYFQIYVQHFLAETCELNFRYRKRAIGESGQTVDFPGFDILMTSGVFSDQPRPRETREDISESQKEFIDLAFRMALIRTAAPPEEGAMLVLETPEASLDSLFIYRAGDLLRNFAEGGGEVGNVLIASSNLNDANMIPALLGIDRRAETTATDIARHMINLLDIAAPNAAMALHGDAYRRQYAVATTPNPSRVPDGGAS